MRVVARLRGGKPGGGGGPGWRDEGFAEVGSGTDGADFDDGAEDALGGELAAQPGGSEAIAGAGGHGHLGVGTVGHLAEGRNDGHGVEGGGVGLFEEVAEIVE